MAEQLTPQTLDLEVRGSSLAHHIVFLDKKMGTGNILLGVTLPWTRIPSRGGVAILLGMHGNWYKLQPFGPWVYHFGSKFSTYSRHF